MTDAISRLSSALADRYTIGRDIGAGGMATVYLAHDIKHNRKVAIKVLRPELSAILGGERFLKEIEVTANLQHPNILPLYDSGAADGFLYYVMPFVEGESLRDRLDREKQLSVEDAVEIARAVAGALDFAHQRGVVHRDIKPENILLQAGQALVADFGIALALSAAAGKGTRLTETGLSIGTPHYMSPEQASADRELDGRTDIYSLGAMLYEMLVGQPPFVAPSAQAIVAKILTEEPPAVSKDRPSVPPNTDAAIQQSLAKLPADRFTSAAAFSAALVNPAFTRQGTAAGPRAAAPTVRGVRMTHVTAGAALLVAGVALGFLVRSGAGDEPRVVRFTLTMTSGQRLDPQRDEDAPFAISPDGELIVFSGFDSTGVERRLFVRRLDQLEAVALPGTDDGVAPFFSPDGLWVGFTTDADDRLRKVPVTGGPPITLADNVQSTLAAASWGDDGYVVYGSNGPGLSRVSGAGGVPEEIVAPDSGQFFMWPSVLPGGEAVLAQQCTGGCAQHDLVIVDVATGETDVLVPGAGRGWYVDAGYLVYLANEAAVYGVRFDVGSRATVGSPIPLLDGVAVGVASVPRLAVSSSGAMIYLPGGAQTGVQVVEVDRQGRAVPIIERPGEYSYPRWSPSQDRIAMAVQDQQSNDIWIYDVESETLSQLTTRTGGARPTWSPDGTRVAFFSTRDVGFDLYWMAADGSMPAERVVDGEDTGNVGATFWTRDGEWIVFDGTVPEEESENIYAVGTGDDRTRQDVVRTDAGAETGAVSPNGEWVAYGSDESGPWEIYVRRFMEPSGRWLVSTGGGGSPIWSADDELLYVDYASGDFVAAKLEFGANVRVTERTHLFSMRNYLYSENAPMYDVSRDGQSFLMLYDPQAVGDSPEPVVVLDWFTEIERRMTAQGGR